jgi:hypothetical protein
MSDVEKAKKPAKKTAKEPVVAPAVVPAELPPVGSAARKAMILQGLIKE